MTKQEVRSLLPKVGDVRNEIPTITVKGKEPEPQECEVVEVHTEHLWYRVKFTATGLHECYKLPKTARLAWEVEK